MPYPTNLDRWGISEELWSFVEEMPYERRPILAFVREVADSLPPGATVLDVGAGDAPYRELFDRCEYLTSDWTGSGHEWAAEADIVAPANALPLDDASVDAVLLTQVLEHVPDPAAVLSEVARVLRPGGGVFVTVPFVWELHELPFDFWRFTPSSLERLLVAAGFGGVAIEPRNDCFTTIAQLMRNVGSAMGRAPDQHDAERDAAAELLEQLADRFAALAPLDVNSILPLGWTVRACRAQ
ncbi:MAG: class I SAM-dependent methyltransferase [Solirubrobacteraceae bacterium]